VISGYECIWTSKWQISAVSGIESACVYHHEMGCCVLFSEMQSPSAPIHKHMLNLNIHMIILDLAISRSLAATLTLSILCPALMFTRCAASYFLGGVNDPVERVLQAMKSFRRICRVLEIVLEVVVELDDRLWSCVLGVWERGRPLVLWKICLVGFSCRTLQF